MLAMTRTDTSPSGESLVPCGHAPRAGSGTPVSAHILENASSRSATAGPRSEMPVSRQGSMPRAGSPTQDRPTQSPVTKPTRPSTASILRWSRESQANGFDRRGGLKQRTSTPAFAKVSPEPFGGLPHGAEPVVDDPHLDSGPRPGHEQKGKLPPDLVLVDDVALEMNRAPGGADGFQPGGVILTSIPEQPHIVAPDERRPRRAREDLFDQCRSQSQPIPRIGRSPARQPTIGHAAV